jgi:hypothetical protein
VRRRAGTRKGLTALRDQPGGLAHHRVSCRWPTSSAKVGDSGSTSPWPARRASRSRRKVGSAPALGPTRRNGLWRGDCGRRWSQSPGECPPTKSQFGRSPVIRQCQQPCCRAAELRCWRAARDSNPNRQIRRLVLYGHAVRLSAVRAAQVRGRIQPDRQSPIWCWLVDCHRDCHRSQQAAADYRATAGVAGQTMVMTTLPLVRPPSTWARAWGASSNG